MRGTRNHSLIGRSDRAAMMRRVGWIALMAGVCCLLAACCGIPLLGKCSKAKVMHISWTASGDCNGGNTVQLYAFALSGKEAFERCEAKALFRPSGNQDLFQKLDLSDSLKLFIKPGESKAIRWTLAPSEKSPGASYLAFVANFANPTSEKSNRALIPLTGTGSSVSVNLALEGNVLTARIRGK